MIFNNAKNLKKYNRKDIVQINTIKFTELYPILDITNRSISYYNVKEQRDELIYSPYNVTFK